MHDAQTLNNKSIHVTLGFMGYTWQDILVDQVNLLAQEHLSIRKGLRPNYWNKTIEYDLIFEEIKTIFQNPSFVENALKQLHSKSINRYGTAYKNPIKLAESITEINLNTVIRKRSLINFKINDEDDSTLLISLFNKELRLPLEFRPVLTYIKNKDSFSVKELPLLDDESQIEITKTLISNGMLEIEFEKKILNNTEIELS